VLTRLWHRTVGGRNHQNRTVHLRRSRHHVLYIVGMARTIHMRIVTLSVSYSTCAVAIVIPRSRSSGALSMSANLPRNTTVRLGHHCRDRCRQGRLAVIHVTDRSHIHMRLGALKLFFCHDIFCLRKFQNCDTRSIKSERAIGLEPTTFTLEG
jgi:hypothetical protein